MWITVPATAKGAHREFRAIEECSGAWLEGHKTSLAFSRRPRPTSTLSTLSTFSTFSSFDPLAASRSGPLIAQPT